MPSLQNFAGSNKVIRALFEHSFMNTVNLDILYYFHFLPTFLRINWLSKLFIDSLIKYQIQGQKLFF